MHRKQQIAIAWISLKEQEVKRMDVQANNYIGKGEPDGGT